MENVTTINAEVLNVVNHISNTFKKGCTTEVTICKVVDNMNKGRKDNINPYFGRLTKVETYGGWQVGTNYKKAVENASLKCGGNGEVHERQTYHTYYNDFFEVSKTNPFKFYLQIQVSANMGSKITTTYYLDGKEVSEEQFEDISKWFKKKKRKQSETQIEANVDSEHEREYRCLSLDNIVSIKQNELCYHNNVEKQSIAIAK